MALDEEEENKNGIEGDYWVALFFASIKLSIFYISICENIIPYYWMPKYTNATDPSARTLTHYTSDKI